MQELLASKDVLGTDPLLVFIRRACIQRGPGHAVAGDLQRHTVIIWHRISAQTESPDNILTLSLTATLPLTPTLSLTLHNIRGPGFSIRLQVLIAISP